MIDPTYFIAPFALLYAFYIILVYAAVYAQKKIMEEGRNWRGVPAILGGVAFFVIIGIVYFGIFTFYYLFYLAFIMIPILIVVPLVFAYKAYSKIKRKEKTVYDLIRKEISWSEALGIIGPVLVLIGCGMLFATSFYYIMISWYSANYLSPLYTWLCSLLGIIGVILGLKGRIYGRFLCFIAGILAIAGIYIHIDTWWMGLTISIFYFDPYIAGFGGLLSIISHKDFLMYYLKGREATEKFISIKEEIVRKADLKLFLQEKLGSDWEKIKISLKAYQAGEFDINTFIKTAVKNIGKKFIDIFKEEKGGKLNDL
ncbi:MAG: hypothetical protein ACFE8J_08975 [Candidatus Heimdallarchaeota archaeon]